MRCLTLVNVLFAFSSSVSFGQTWLRNGRFADGIAPTQNGGFVVIGTMQDPNVEGLSTSGLSVHRVFPSGNDRWAKRYWTPTRDDRGVGAITLRDGGFLILGTTGHLSGQLAADTSSHARVVRIDADGNPVWQHKLAVQNNVQSLERGSERADGSFVLFGKYYSSSLIGGWVVVLGADGEIVSQQVVDTAVGDSGFSEAAQTGG